MHLFDRFIDCYGWEGIALGGALLLLLVVQLCYHILAYGRIASFRNNRRQPRLDAEPPVSVIVPMFSEDYAFVEERLPLMLAQNYHRFEVVIVYVGQDSDFYDDLARLKHSFPQIATTKIKLDPRFPISRKMALNVGIKSAHYEHLLLTSTDTTPPTDRWISLMAKGFTRGEIVVGYCGAERGAGFANRMIRTDRMMQAASWLARAVNGKPHRAMLQNYGFTKSLYFGFNGFNRLNMNIGEDDLFMQEVMTRANVSVILSPKATLREKVWGGLKWWWKQRRYYGAAFRYYPLAARTARQEELVSRALFFLAALCALAVMPVEYKIGVAILVAVRYGIVLFEVRRIARRLGESGLTGLYFLYDLLSPLWEAALAVAMMRRDDRVWR